MSINKEKITHICIDDFALKKRKFYGTVMIDINSHKIIDMIDSRKYDDVKEWISTYPNIEVVSRDGSITYQTAVSGVDPRIIQISDRFHLQNNLISYSKNYLKKVIKSHIVFKNKYKIEKSIDQKPKKKKIRIKDLLHEEKVAAKKKLINEIKKLKETNMSIREISRKTGLSRITIRKYLDKNCNPVHASYGIRKLGLLTPYKKQIDEQFSHKKSTTGIENMLRKEGYTGSSSNIRNYISKYKEQKPKNSADYITRNDVFKLLYLPIERIKTISYEQFDEICKEFPSFKAVHTLVWKFKSLYTAKSENLLISWLEEAENLKIREIDRFVSGIKRDIEGVKNSIKLGYNNGLAEGCINKLKR